MSVCHGATVCSLRSTFCLSQFNVSQAGRVKYFIHMAADKRLLWLVGLCSALSLCLLSSFLFLRLSSSSGELILPSLFPTSLRWLYDCNHPFAAAVVTGGVYSCSEHHIWWHQQNEVYQNVAVYVYSIYWTGLDPSRKATGVTNAALSLCLALCVAWALLHQKMRNINRYCTAIHQFVSAFSCGVSDLSMNGGFMSAVCLSLSVSSTKPPRGVEDALACVKPVYQSNLFWQAHRDVW